MAQTARPKDYDEDLPTAVGDLSSELATKQDQLASDINELLDRVNPAHIAKRAQANVTHKVKSFFVADSGEVRLPQTFSVGGGAVGVATLVVLKKSLGASDSSREVDRSASFANGPKARTRRRRKRVERIHG